MNVKAWFCEPCQTFYPLHLQHMHAPDGRILLMGKSQPAPGLGWLLDRFQTGGIK